MAFPPVRCVLRIAGPLVAHSYATCEADAAVDDQELAVRAIVQASKVLPGQFVVELRGDPIAADQWWAQEDSKSAPEIRIATRIQPAWPVEQPFLGGRKIRPDGQCGGRVDAFLDYLVQAQRVRPELLVTIFSLCATAYSRK